MSLKERRKKLNLTQKELAEQTGLNIRLIQDYEQGHRDLAHASVLNAYRIAAALNCNVDDLIEDDLPAKQYDGLRMSVYYCAEKTADVHVSKNKVFVKRYTRNAVKQIFFADQMNTFQLSKVFESRLWPRNRDNIDIILKSMDLEFYNPLEMVRKTHGRMYNDHIWFKFGNENIDYETLFRGEEINV